MIDSDSPSMIDRYRRCLDLQRRIGHVRDPELLAQLAMSEVSGLLDADRSTLFLFDWDTMELRANFAAGISGRPLVVPLRMGIVGTAILRRELANVTNAYAHPYFNPEIDSALGYKTDSLLVVPIVATDGRILGGLELLNKASGRFTSDDERLAISSAANLSRWLEQDRAYPAGIEAEIVALRNNVGCDRGTLFTLDTATSRLVAAYADGGDGRPLSLNIKLGIAGMVAVTGQSVCLNDVSADPRFNRSVDHRTGYQTRTMLCVPLVSRSSDTGSETVGVLQVINKHVGAFDVEDQTLLEALAASLAITVENARLFAEQRRQFLSMVEAMAASVDAHGATTVGHCGRTVERALAVGRALGLSADDLELLRVATALHDHGMIGVDDAVVNKAGPLDATEQLHVRRHTGLTEEILNRIYLSRHFRPLPLIAAAHHEAMDGSGYPRGLRGHEIPFLARIIAAVDTYEALIADRPYRPALTNEAAWQLIVDESGRRFDPVVVAALKEVLNGTAANG
jgi:GAF domain-containing protein